jgi:hypothetical protein
MARALRDAVRAEAETTTHAGTRDAGPVAFDAHDETTAVLKTRPRKRRLGLIALALLGVVAAGAVAVATLNLNKQPAALAARENIAATPPKTIPRSKRPKRPKRAPALVHVPSFAGLTEASADSLAHRYKLGLGVGRQPSSQTPSGNVISQSPLVGARVGRGTVVTLEVSTGPPPVAVPALTNQPLANAEAELRSSSLTWTVNFTNGQGDSPGTVMSQTPAPGTSVAPGSPVGLDVARSLSWHTVADIELNSAGASDRFTITGHKWRLRYVLTFPPCPYGICPSLLLSVTGDGFDSYQLSAGTHQTEVPEPPGTYAINVFGTGKFTLNVVVEEYS